MRKLIAAGLLFAVKILSTLFYRCESHWIGHPGPHPWSHARLMIFLNHTSLFEPLFFSQIPFRTLWRAAGEAIFPGADKTLDRPLVGKFWKLLSKNVVSVSRKRDETWDHFLEIVRQNPKALIAIAPEGRMKRPNGLDSENKPMSVRGGIADVLERLPPEGDIILAYSGGLHHVQKPGEGLPKLFKTIRINFERVPIKDYLASLKGAPDFKTAVIVDLESRQKRHCPASLETDVN